MLMCLLLSVLSQMPHLSLIICTPADTFSRLLTTQHTYLLRANQLNLLTANYPEHTCCGTIRCVLWNN